MQITVEVNDQTWGALSEALQKIQTQEPGERPGEIIIRPVFDSPEKWLAEIIHQNIAQHVPVIPSAAARLKIAEADALRREAEDLLKAERGVSVRAGAPRRETL